MPTTFQLQADGMSAAKLQQALKAQSPDVATHLEADSQTTRSSSLSDPQVLTAVISAGSAVVSALIVAYSAIHSARIAERQDNNPAQINIYTTSSEGQPAVQIHLDGKEPLTMREVEDAYPVLEKMAPTIARMHFVVSN